MQAVRRDSGCDARSRSRSEAFGASGAAAPQGGSSTRVRRRVRLPLTLCDGRTVVASVVTFHELPDAAEHLALLFPAELQLPVNDGTGRPLRVRLHSECLTGDVFGSERCDCGAQLRETVELLAQTGGILLYLRQEGRGVGLYNKLDAYDLQDAGLDTYAANRKLALAEDARDYGVAAAMLAALGVRSVRLLTNNPDKAWQLACHSISVVEVLPTAVHLSPHNAAYLRSKREHAGHFLPGLLA
jgi:GTP cyclohydrolase II